MDIPSFSGSYMVRRLTPDDVEPVCDMMRKNELFYRFHPPLVTRESILADMRALPPGKRAEDKYYLGFFEDGCLVAVMDLILSYPAPETAFLGFFMTNVRYQRRGVGSGIVEDVLRHLKRQGFSRIRLGVDHGNPQSLAFWTKNGFSVVGDGAYIPMERAL